MKRTLLISLLALGLLVLALGGWAVQGLRWVVRPGRVRTRRRLAPA